MTSVLIVEDDDPIRGLVMKVLKRDGHIVSGARHGGEAIAQLSNNNFDVMVLDVMMPVASALEVLDFMRARQKWTPTIILTAAHDRQLATLNMDGVFAIVKKPFDLDALRNVVAATIPALPK